MDQKKIGSFLKQLRNEKGMTQEQLAEHFNVSGRTVSRWETGSNMPDISIVTDIADFFEIDVRELIDGERKNDMNEEIKEVAEKMADYAGSEKGRLFKWVRVISFIGTGLLTAALVFQCVHYEPSIFSFLAVLFSFIALIAMAITTLYANGVLRKLTKKKTLTIVIGAFVIALVAVAVKFIVSTMLIIGIAALEMLQPADKSSEKQEYDKQYLLDEYSGELNSLFMTFPDSLENAISSKYDFYLKTGLFDTDGYVILKVEYNDADFENEVERLSNITCRICFQDQEFISNVMYDEEMYNYPAYIANDGFDDAYEYALIDANDNEIIYVAISYPNVIDLVKLNNYTKKNPLAYEINGPALNQFTIYSHQFEGNDWWDGASLDEQL